jgi:hypothetical protein
MGSVSEFCRRYGNAEAGTPVTVRIRRGDDELTLEVPLEFRATVRYSVAEGPNAAPGAVRVRRGILSGTGP